MTDRSNGPRTIAARTQAEKASAEPEKGPSAASDIVDGPKGAELDEAVRKANEAGADIKASLPADEKRAALREFQEGSE